MCIFHFSYLSVLLAIFLVIQCLCLIFQVLQFSCHNTGPTLCISHFYVSHCFSPYSRSYNVHFSFSPFLSVSCQFRLNSVVVSFPTFFSFLAIFQVLQCSCLIFHAIQFSCHNSGPRVFISHFSRFSLFFTIFQVIQCAFLIFHVIQCFSPYSSSYSVCVSFSTFFRVSSHIPGQTVFVAHFPRFSVFSLYTRSYSVDFSFSCFSVFLTIFQVIPCLCYICQLFQFPRHNPGTTVCISHFSRFSLFLAIISVLQ